MSAPPKTTPSETPLSLPTDTTPSWEIELLISGALAFASLQLPGLLDGWFLSLAPRLPESLEMAAVMVYVFAKGIAIVLTITFGLHILLRGFWAAGLGLHSVYPDGILWDRIKSGPIFLRVSQQTTMTLPQYVSRLDNAASIVFALGGLLLQMTLISGLGTVVVFGVRDVAIRLTGDTISMVPFFLLVAVLPMLALFGASALDKQMSGRWAPDARGPRWIERIARGAGLFGLGRWFSPMMLVFSSRMGQVKGTVTLVVLIYLAFGIVLLQAMAAFGVVQLDGYRFLSDRGAGVVDPSHYRDQRDGKLRYETIPFIPSETVGAGLLRLFAPYRIEQFDAAAERACPDAVRDATGADTVRAKVARDSVVACIGRQLDVRLDGVPVANLRWLAGTDPASEFRGLLTQVPIGALPEGAHVLSVTRLPRRRALTITLASKAPPPAERYEIPFWIDRTAARLAP